MPGSFVDIMLFGGANQETIQAFKTKWGLNQPLYIQYWEYLINFLQLEMGTSLQFREPVIDFVRMKIFNTLILAAPGITVGYLLGSVIGTVMGNLRGSRFERYGIITLITVGSFPGFFIGIILILIFAVWLNIFPTSGMLSPTVSAQFADAAWWRPYLTQDFAFHYVLPFSAVVLRFLYSPTMVMRTSVVEVMGQDFNYYNRVSGLPYAKRLKHLGRHAILPVITLYPVSMTRAISGLVLIEVVFNWPGIGFALVQAVLSRDFPVVQFVFFITAAIVIISNFAVDIIYGIIDPRISVGED
jgi:peptide/nickel transport system permease protein